MGNTGKVLEAALREAGRSQAEVRHVASGAGAIQSRATGTQEGFRRRRTLGEAAGGPRTDAELCARCRATPMANGNAQEAPGRAATGTSCALPFAIGVARHRAQSSASEVPV